MSAVEAGPSRAGPSTPRKQMNGDDEEGVNPRSNLAATLTPSGVGAGGGSGPHAQGEEGDEDGDEERMDIKLIQSFADKIQHLPSTGDIDGATGRVSISIPKRGEKDFEPLEETVNLQDMMLQKSREALFNALVGVRGGHNKSISHAIMTPSNPFPRVLIIHGHLLDTIGITVRAPSPSAKGKGKTSLQLLPEEALYLVERGSLQIWVGRDPSDAEADQGVGEWCEEEYGVKGAVEMSVMECFAAFIGREGLSWERYQAYAYLKRLGYTVHRSRQFIPTHFLADSTAQGTISTELAEQDPALSPFRTWWLSIPGWVGRLCRALWRGTGRVVQGIAGVGLGVGHIMTGRRRPFKGTLLDGWKGATYSSIFSHLRIIPAGHSHPLPSRPLPPALSSPYDALKHNPYFPFFHIWKPSTPWNKRGWDKGSEQGLKTARPDYFAAVVESRNTPIPTINQLSEIFNMLPDEPKGPVKKVGPQYQRAPRPARPQNQNTTSKAKAPSTAERVLGALGLGWLLDPAKKETPFVNLAEIRNGDRAFVVAVNDSGNTGWIRFGRTGFAEALVI